MVAHVVVLSACVLFALAGRWQLDRLHEKRERIALVRHRGALPTLSSPTQAWRRVRLEGTYDAGHQVLLRSRELDGRPGMDVLTPLRTYAGDAVIVDRGWVPFGTKTAPEPPGSTTTIEGVLVPSAHRTRFGPKDPPGTLTSVGIVDIPRLQRQMPYALAPFWVHLTSKDALPLAALPVPGEGPHLSYAVQWFLFIPTALACYAAWIVRWARR